jgi:lipid-A-disaccharide synthase
LTQTELAMRSSEQALRIAMVAGEASGDLLASLVLDKLKEHWPQLRAQGIGGSRMVRSGFEAQWPSEKLAVFGYLDALRVYRSLSRIRSGLVQQWTQKPPNLFIGFDAPDFNFGLERQLRQQGVKTLHVVCPSFWAWRPARVKVLAECADHVLCLFPFEPPLLAAHGIKASYIGHPLASVIPLQPDKAKARVELGIAERDTLIALLPGSRRSEVQHIAPTLLETARLLAAKRPGIRFALPTTVERQSQVVQLIEAEGLSALIQVVLNGSHQVLMAADTAIVASGTATLEAALCKCPMVIVYRVGRVSGWLLRHMHLQKWVGLPNILANEEIVPELLQDAAQPVAIAREVERWLDEPARVQAVQPRFMDLHRILRQDTGAIAVKVVDELVYAALIAV